MVNEYKFLDVCELCESRELDFVLFDLKAFKESTYIIRDIPGFKCRVCGELLISNSVIEIMDELKISDSSVVDFPVGEYQKAIIRLGKIEREIAERYLHSWNLIRADGREFFEEIGLRSLGDWHQMANA